MSAPNTQPTCEPVSGAKYRRWIASEMRNDGGRGFWLTCNRPFSEAATDLFMDAMRSNKPAPDLRRRQRPTLAQPAANAV